TITMQLVRVLEPRPRTLTSKVIESFRALQLEMRLSKREILAAYLEFVPYGKNVEGVEAASLSYFGHRADALSPAEIATLLAVPQNPGARHPSAENAARLRAARDEIARRLAVENALPHGKGAAKVSTADLLTAVAAAPVPGEMQRFPREAPHAARWLKDGNPGLRCIRTTLDKGVQRLAERTMRDAQGDLARRGIFNGSTVIVDHTRGDVVAMVGNFDFWDEKHGGQIVGFANPRSPGSALKPFLYAEAIDGGVANPSWLVNDVPSIFGGYAPRNYDGTWSGLVRLDDALSKSLNMPFVMLLADVGVEPFLARLRAMGVTSLDPEPGRYGLSAVVGGVEITPLEIAGLYATLANGGRYRPLRWLGAREERADQPVMSPGAAWLTRAALKRKDRPDFPRRREFSSVPADIFWKTGTSFGHRDAWAAGAGPRYAAVVWLGNFDETPSVDLVGADAAGPLLFDLLEGVAPRSGAHPDDRPPADLTRVEVCAWSGRLATHACPKTEWAFALRSHVPTATCAFHVAVDVDVKSGEALSPTCRSSHEFETRTFTVIPASVRRWLSDENRRFPEPPRYAPGCEPPGARRPPVILSPSRGQVALILPGVPVEQQQLALEAESVVPGGQVSWFVDGRFLGTARADERLWWVPQPGTHELAVADDAGLTTRRKLEVRDRP
ncbi:MAG TPA: penicillin-binding protein 1C, partial [bacterium]|nr:penicillin-binding protein 1C [bacterium]